MKRLILLSLLSLPACEAKHYILSDGTEANCAVMHVEACGVILKNCDNLQSYYCEDQVTELPNEGV